MSGGRGLNLGQIRSGVRLSQCCTRHKAPTHQVTGIKGGQHTGRRFHQLHRNVVRINQCHGRTEINPRQLLQHLDLVTERQIHAPPCSRNLEAQQADSTRRLKQGLAVKMPPAPLRCVRHQVSPSKVLGILHDAARPFGQIFCVKSHCFMPCLPTCHPLQRVGLSASDAIKWQPRAPALWARRWSPPPKSVRR